MKVNRKIVIIGGGLSGLTLAYLLLQKNIKATILEASSRLGGRIYTVKGNLGTPLELGATWFSDMHPHLLSLIRELDLQQFPQFSRGISLFQTKSFEAPQQFFIPESEAPSYRLAGGTQMLIEALAERLDRADIHLNAKVTSARELPDGVIVTTEGGKAYEADIAISCIPLPLAASLIAFSPQLPPSISGLLPTVQTWMAGAVKFTLEYGRPFWRDKGFSGMLYSHAGIITEMYDHTSFREDSFGITGFLNGNAALYSYDVRKELVLVQLGELLGDEARQPVAYFDKIWNDEWVSAGKQEIHRPHQNNGHPLLHMPYLNGKFFFCGTETAGEFAGYMEGAVIAAKAVLDRL